MSELITPASFTCPQCDGKALRVLSEHEAQCVGCGSVYIPVHRHHFDEVVEEAEEILRDA